MSDYPRLLPGGASAGEDDDFPRGSSDLIDLLDKAYPHRCLRIDEDVTEHHRYSAVRDMIDQMISWRDEALYGNDDTSVPDDGL
jgi:hypothetical protein